MTDRPDVARGEHPIDRLPAYLLHDLPDLEMREIERHLSECQACEHELEKLQEAFVDVVEGLPQEDLPNDLWDRIETRVREQHAVDVPVAVGREVHSEAPPPPTERRPRTARGWAMGMAASLLIAATLGIWGALQRENYLASRAEVAATQEAVQALAEDHSRVADWLAQDDVTVRTMPAADTASAQGASAGSVLFLPDGRALIVMREPPEEGKDFQAWGIRGDDADSLGVFGGHTLEIPLEEYEAVAVTLEPDGGSEEGTTLLGAVPTS